jgi:pimeloyl-ACP methyl ester carboxylesterase
VDGRDRVTLAHATCTSFDGLPIAYATAGTRGPALVFIHGWSCQHAFWREQFALADAFRIITLDLPGHGRSQPAAARAAWSMAAFARDVEAAIEAAGADDVVLIGHSMGGAVGVEVALRLGRRCRLLLGVDTFTDERFYRRRPAAEVRARCATFAADFSGTMTKMVERLVAPEADPALVRWIAAQMAAAPIDDKLAALDALLAWDIDDRWPLLSCAVETINSALLASPAHEIELAGLRDHAMTGVGHFPMLEAPARFNAALRAILERTTTRA